MKLNKNLLISVSKNKRYINRYFKLIEAYINKQDEIIDNYEKHHILPKCIFKEYEHSKWNIAKIPPRVHYIAHFLLYKADIDSKLTFAFNMMNLYREYQNGRSLSKLLNNSKIYENFKKDMIIAIKLTNTNQLTVIDKLTNLPVRISSDEYANNKSNYIHPNAGNVLIINEDGNKIKMTSKEYNESDYEFHTTNKVVVKDTDRNILSVDITDERYLSGELVFSWDW